MKRALRFGTACAVLGLLASAVGEACSATSSVDTARRTRDRDDYKKARDVASEFIDKENSTKSTDAEKFVKDTLTLDAATGTLLIDAGASTKTYGDGSLFMATYAKTADEFRALLDQASFGGHGYTADLQPKWGMSWSSSEGDRTDVAGHVTIREHMRQHVYEWDVFLKTGREMETGMAQSAADAARFEKGGDMYRQTYAGSRPGQSSPVSSAPKPAPVHSAPAAAPKAPSAPPVYYRIVPATPAPVSAPAAPAPEPVEILHHAG